MVKDMVVMQKQTVIIPADWRQGLPSARWIDERLNERKSTAAGMNIKNTGGRNIILKESILKKIADNDPMDIQLANSLRGFLGGLSPDEGDKYFEKYLQTAKNVLDLLYGADEQLQLLAIATIRLHYSKERYMASELITFINCMSAREIRPCSIFFNEENNVPDVMQTAF